MSWLKEWIRTILVLVLFAGFLELLLPSNAMKRFVQLVLGLFVLATILGPVGILTSRLRQDPAFELPVVAASETSTVLQNGRQVAERQRNQVLEEYRRSIARQVSSLLRLSGHEQVLDIEVEVEEGIEQPTFGQLRSLRVTVPETRPGEASDNEKLARLLADFYGLNPTQVHVASVPKGG